MSLMCSPASALARVARIAGVVVALAAVAPAARAQRATPPATLQSNAPGEADLQLRKNAGFSLFGNADLAGAGMKMSGQFGWGLSNLGPCAEGFVIFQCGDIFQDGAYQFNLFELVYAAGVPFSDFRKIRAAHQGANGMRAPTGYSAIFTGNLVGATQDWGPADGSIGRLFSGSAVSTGDNSCQDHRSALSGYMSVGVTLLATSDCPPTWPATGFDGPRPVPQAAFERAFTADPNGFSFDFFSIPQTERDLTRFLGNYSTYGETSDSYAEILTSYGSVTPKGAGAPRVGGFPLGLDIRFEAFRFNLPALSNAFFYNMIVVNNSAKVYNTGIDYDSLYMGVNPGVFGGDPVGNQIPAYYPIFSKNALVSTPNGVNPGCNGSIQYPGSSPCFNAGFFGGAIGFVMLKSPIGDTRNKLLTRPGPFNNAASPFADDTITFNHMHHCGFGGTCYNSTYLANDRRGFGMLASMEEHVLDARDPSSLTPGTTWTTFRNKNFRGASGNETARFNRFVPGATLQQANNDPVNNPQPGQPYGQWDYNNDGVQDTIFADACADQGCVATWADTMPGKQSNAVGNVGASMTAGPFKLAAGDTTSFVFAFIGAPDSTGFERVLNSVIESYNSFYLTPEAPPSPTVTSVEVAAARTAFASFGARPAVSIVLGNEVLESYQDVFLTNYANNLETSTQRDVAALNILNPGLSERIREVAEANLAALYVFKSCDNGATFTADTSCVGAPTVAPSGATIGVGFRPYATIDIAGGLPATYTDVNVTAGRRYLYSFVAQSRGFSEPIRDVDPTDDSPECAADVSACRQIIRVLTVADSITGALARSGPTTATVYVPVSLPAGGRASGADVTTLAGNATVPVGVRAGQSATSGNYRLVFANKFRVTITTTIATGAAVSTVAALDTVASALVNGVTVAGYIRDSTIVSGEGRVAFSGTAFVPTTVDTTFDGGGVATAVNERGEIGEFGYLLTDGTKPYFISVDLATPSTFIARGDFPGFLVDIDASVANTLQREVLIRARPGETTGDSLQTGLLNNNALQFQEATTVRRSGSGTYQFVFRQDAFGPQKTFRVDTVGGVEPAVQQSLRDRTVATTGVTGLAVDTLIRTQVTTARYRPAGVPLALVPATFPFVVLTPSGDTALLAALARGTPTARPATIVLGTGGDTVRVAVPDTATNFAWVPGDEFVVLERIMRDEVDANGAVVIDPETGDPVQVPDTVVAFGPTVLGCNTPRVSCNPVTLGTRGATGYLPYEDGYRLVIDYPRPFTEESEVQLAVRGASAATAQITRADLANVRVVPNPYIFQSQFDQVSQRTADPRILFTGVPGRGVLRVYSVSGQFLQELTWTEADLATTNGATGTGDLPYNLRTREGTDLSSGLYIYVIKPTGPDAGNQVARGKFVIIR